MYLTGLLWELKKLIWVKCLEQFLAHSKGHLAIMVIVTIRQ